MAAGLVFARQGRLKGSFFAPARTEIPLFRALVAVVGAARADGEITVVISRRTTIHLKAFSILKSHSGPILMSRPLNSSMASA